MARALREQADKALDAAEAARQENRYTLEQFFKAQRKRIQGKLQGHEHRINEARFGPRESDTTQLLVSRK